MLRALGDLVASSIEVSSIKSSIRASADSSDLFRPRKTRFCVLCARRVRLTNAAYMRGIVAFKRDLYIYI